MIFFPLCNLIAMIILYKIHHKVFVVTTILELLINGIGIYYIYTNFARPENQFLYMLALTGGGFIIALIAFFVAIQLNQKHLYIDHE